MAKATALTAVTYGFLDKANKPVEKTFAIGDVVDLPDDAMAPLLASGAVSIDSPKAAAVVGTAADKSTG